jgi:transposase
VSLYAAIDIHKHVFQAAVVDSESGEVTEARFAATREKLEDWAMRWQGRVEAVAVEATTGWRWVAQELQKRGFEVQLVDPGQASALQGRRRRPKTDRLDARWLALLLSRKLAPASWLPPPDIQRLRDQTRLRKALVDDHSCWAARIHALLTQEGWPCRRMRLLRPDGPRWVEGLPLSEGARAYVQTALAVMATISEQVAQLDAELGQLARRDPRLRALQTIYGVGPIIACHLLAEIGEARRFQRPRQLVRVAGLDPVVADSGERQRRGRLSKQGSPQLRWALVQAAQHAARSSSPDQALYRTVTARRDTGRAKLTIARKIAHRAYHVLAAAEAA